MPLTNGIGGKLLTSDLILKEAMWQFKKKEVAEVKGFDVFIAEANRKQVALALEKSSIVMIFKTDAKTIEEAEEEFTNEPEKLASRLQGAINKTKQGVLLCQE